MSNTEITMWKETALAISKMLRIAGYKVYLTQSSQDSINIKVYDDLDTQSSEHLIAFYSVDLNTPVSRKNKYGDFQLTDLYAWAEGLIKKQEDTYHV